MGTLRYSYQSLELQLVDAIDDDSKPRDQLYATGRIAVTLGVNSVELVQVVDNF